MTPDGRAHIVTFDGKTDLVGPILPDLTSIGLNITSAGVGSDGKTFAYAASELDLVDLTSKTPARAIQVYGGFYDILWSTQQDKLYSNIDSGKFFYVTLATGQVTNVTSGDGSVSVVGWIDDTHLIATSYQGAHYVDDGRGNKFPTSVKLVSLDLASGQERTIASIQSGSPAWFRFILSPDGSQALYYNAPNEQAPDLGLPYIPQVALITLATGRVTWLPAIAKRSGGGFFSVAWRPGSETARGFAQPPAWAGRQHLAAQCGGRHRDAH
ncbi:MAG TPA: hypothetical protein VF808_06615 [Ktedonobacterales bacterium]